MLIRRGNDLILNTETNIDAVNEFKYMFRNFTESQAERAQIRKSMPVVNIETSQLEWEDENGNINTEVIRGLTQKENELLRDMLFPNRNVISDPKSRIEPECSLQKQIDYISETIGYTERELDQTSNQELREELQIRIDGLNEARELTRRQKCLKKPGINRRNT